LAQVMDLARLSAPHPPRQGWAERLSLLSRWLLVVAPVTSAIASVAAAATTEEMSCPASGDGREECAKGPEEQYLQYYKHLQTARQKANAWAQEGTLNDFGQNVTNLLGYDFHMSRALPERRTIPDTRFPACKKMDYSMLSNADAPRVSVVVPFYNEYRTVLLRTARSVLDRTPPNLLEEILLVDDGSDASWSPGLRGALQRYGKVHPKLRLIHNEKHLGLMNAKMAGSRQSKGEVLVFLDSHCEANVGWLEPLLASIVAHNHTVAVPIIDPIHPHDFTYSRGKASRGVLSPGLYFAGRCCFNHTEEAMLWEGLPVPLPAMPGGLFAISRRYFEVLGGYDEGLRGWGAENTELTFKVWRCLDGRIEINPCSRVGHIYKEVKHSYPPGHGLHKNYLRIAAVWLDGYREVWTKAFPLAGLLRPGNVSSQRATREGLSCKSFRWYTKHVDPGFFEPRGAVQEGLLVPSQEGSNGAVSLPFGTALASNAFQPPHQVQAMLLPLNHFSDYNYWFLLPSGRLVHLGIWIEECLGARAEPGGTTVVLVCQCALVPGSGCTEDEITWDFQDYNGELRHRTTSECLAAVSGTLTTEACGSEEAKTWHKWRFESHPGRAVDHNDDGSDEAADEYNARLLPHGQWR